MVVTTTVQPATIATALGLVDPDPGTTRFDQWSMWINDAVRAIQRRVDKLQVADPLDQEDVDYVVRQAVVAQVTRPDDATQVTISVDDAATTKTYRSGRGRVTIEDDWWDLLGLTENSTGAFSVDTAPTNPVSLHVDWCSLAFGANYCSCGGDIAGTPIYEGGEWA